MGNELSRAHNTMLATSGRSGRGAVEDPIIRENVIDLVDSTNKTLAELYKLSNAINEAQAKLTKQLTALDKYHTHFGARVKIKYEASCCCLTGHLEPPNFKYDYDEDIKEGQTTKLPSEVLKVWRYPEDVRRRLMQQQADEQAEKEDFAVKDEQE